MTEIRNKQWYIVQTVKQKFKHGGSDGTVHGFKTGCQRRPAHFYYHSVSGMFWLADENNG